MKRLRLGELADLSSIERSEKEKAQKKAQKKKKAQRMDDEEEDDEEEAGSRSWEIYNKKQKFMNMAKQVNAF